MISHALELLDTPMWVGFNCRIHDIDTLQQHISYLTMINASPTSHSVGLETMQQSKKIAEELNQSSIQVTYLGYSQSRSPNTSNRKTYLW